MTETDLRERIEAAVPVPPRPISIDEVVRRGRRRQRARRLEAIGATAASVVALAAAASVMAPQRGEREQPASATSGPEIGRTVAPDQVRPVGLDRGARPATDADVLAIAEPGGQELLGYTTLAGVACLQIRGEITGSCLPERLGADPYRAAEPVAVASDSISFDGAGAPFGNPMVPYWGAVPATTRMVRFTGGFGTREVRAFAGGSRYGDRAFVLAYIQTGRAVVFLEALGADGQVLASRHYPAPEPPEPPRG